MNECRHRWNRYWTFGSLAVIFASAAAAMAIGRFTISPRELAAVLVPGAFPGEEVPGQVRTVISNIRLPRVLLALLSGAGLAAAGTAFQGLFANPLATPDTLGAANGASFGAVLGILLGLPAFGIQLLAMILGIAAVLMAWSVGRVKGAMPPLMVILAGMVVSSRPCLPGEIRCRPPGCASRHFLLAHGQHGKHHKGHPGHGGAVHPDRQRAAVPVKVEA